jgi:ribosome maturation protein Sdo1
MGKQLHRVVYKPDSQSTDEFMVIVDNSEYQRWKEDKSVAIALVVDSFDVFHSGQGSQGKMMRPSKQQLDSIFGTTREEEVVEQILSKGELKAGEGYGKELSGLNPARGGTSIDTRGSGGSLRG